MLISLSFSAFIYQSISIEFKRRLEIIERRLELRKHGFRVPEGQDEFFILDLIETRKRVLFLLLYTNGVIFMFSAAAGYFLAGKTLEPIEKALEEQRRFVADASHELKTPLTALQTSIEVALRDKKLKLKDARRILKESLDDIGSLRSLSNNLLTLASYQQNGSNLLLESVSIKDITEDVFKKMTPLAKKKGVKVKVSSGNIYMNADRGKVEKLVTILLDNSVKFTPKGGNVSVSVNKDSRCVYIKVKDSGVGIAKEDIPHIFKRFYRVDTSRSKVDVSGFGLGLAMAKRIIDLHKGTVNVISTLNKGSTFIVKLPLGLN
jgi:signal transduction histidine kinase